MANLISKQCIDFVKSFEGFSATVYRDIVNVPTIGYGMTGKEIEGLKTITEQQASTMLEKLLNDKYAVPIKRNLDSMKFTLNQNEFDALVSMAYNIGVGGLLGSTLYKNVLQGIKDKKIITSGFQAWSKAGGKRVEGLFRRRTEEAEMFFKPIPVVKTVKKPYQERYVREFQKFYNTVTQTTTPLTVDGIWGTESFKALNILESLLKGEYK